MTRGIHRNSGFCRRAIEQRLLTIFDVAVVTMHQGASTSID
jgi:hypothetical protein